MVLFIISPQIHFYRIRNLFRPSHIAAMIVAEIASVMQYRPSFQTLQFRFVRCNLVSIHNFLFFFFEKRSVHSNQDRFGFETL